MKTLLGLINLNDEQVSLDGLIDHRNQASIPFAGRYRLIDFTLSNMVNANIHEIGIFIPQKFRSLMDHLGDGSAWNLDRRHGGLFIFPPEQGTIGAGGQGDLHFFQDNRDYFERSESDYVFISGSQLIANVQVDKAFERHLAADADLTFITIKDQESNPAYKHCPRLILDDAGYVTKIAKDKRSKQLFTGMYMIKKSLLTSLVDKCESLEHKNILDCITAQIGKMKAITYEHDAYYAYIQSLEGYYRHTMELLDEGNYRALFYDGALVRTKTITQPSIHFQARANVKRSILANGTTVQGEVENSVIFRGVEIAEAATVKNSIIMQRSIIEAGAYLEHVILDKEVHIRAHERLVGTAEAPYYVKKRATI